MYLVDEDNLSVAHDVVVVAHVALARSYGRHHVSGRKKGHKWHKWHKLAEMPRGRIPDPVAEHSRGPHGLPHVRHGEPPLLRLHEGEAPALERDALLHTLHAVQGQLRVHLEATGGVNSPSTQVCQGLPRGGGCTEKMTSAMSEKIWKELLDSGTCHRPRNKL